MKRRVEDWSIEKLDKERTRITFPEYQREKRLWPNEKKSVLIDSVLRDIDIPKLYFNELRDQNIEVVDGQQRLWSVWDFLDDEFPYMNDGRRQFYSELTAAEKQRLKQYKFQITMFREADDDYLRELFVRLQLGLLLNAGEKLHATKGKMKSFIFSTLVSHQFILHLGIPKRRYARETLCAQICINSFSRAKLREFSRTRYDDLLHFFTEYADPRGPDLALFTAQSAKIASTLDQLWKCLGEDARQLRNRSYILSIYLFVEELVAQSGDLSKRECKSFADFVAQLWKRLKEEMRLGVDRKNRELYSFETLLSSAPGEEYQIKRRHERLADYYSHYKDKGKIKGDR
jgi:hypothetical protein